MPSTYPGGQQAPEGHWHLRLLSGLHERQGLELVHFTHQEIVSLGSAKCQNHWAPRQACGTGRDVK